MFAGLGHLLTIRRTTSEPQWHATLLQWFWDGLALKCSPVNIYTGVSSMGFKKAVAPRTKQSIAKKGSGNLPFTILHGSFFPNCVQTTFKWNNAWEGSSDGIQVALKAGGATELSRVRQVHQTDRKSISKFLRTTATLYIGEMGPCQYFFHFEVSFNQMSISIGVAGKQCSENEASILAECTLCPLSCDWQFINACIHHICYS